MGERNEGKKSEVRGWETEGWRDGETERLREGERERREDCFCSVFCVRCLVFLKHTGLDCQIYLTENYVFMLKREAIKNSNIEIWN